MVDSRRSFVVHVYTEQRCTVEDVRTGVVIAVGDMAGLSKHIATLLGSGGEEGPDRDPSNPLGEISGQDAGVQAGRLGRGLHSQPFDEGPAALEVLAKRRPSAPGAGIGEHK